MGHFSTPSASQVLSPHQLDNAFALLTIRTFLKRFTRLALGFSKKLENLAACVSLYIAHCNYCRMYGSLPGTPAMAAGIAWHPWTLDELYDAE